MIFVRKMYSELLRQLFLVFFVLVLIISISQMIRFLKMLSAGRITISALFKLLALVIPSALWYLIPPCMLLAIILVLCRYYIDHEMVVLQSSGVSPFRIYRIIMCFALGIAVIVSIMTFVITPYTELIRKSGYEYAVKQVSLAKIESKQFVDLGDDALIYAQQQTLDRSRLTHVYLFRKLNHSKQKSWSVLYAHSMNQDLVHLAGSKKSFVVFSHGSVDTVDQENHAWQHITFAKMYRLLPGFQYTERLWPRNLNFFDLWQAAKSDHQAAALLALKLSVVLSVFILAFFGCVVGYAKPRQGKVLQLIPALIFYGVYVYAITFLQQKVEAGSWSLWQSFFEIHSVFILVCILFVFIRCRHAIMSRLRHRLNK
jgi:lipopolysaccharide export system permease protein